LHPYLEDAEFQTNDFSIGDLPLQEGQSMVFVYDFGTSWRFNVTLEKIEPPNRKMKKPRVVESHGKPPAEYDFGDYDEDEDEDENEDEG
jgi:hypothetical protein